LADFLQMERDQVVKLYMESIERNIVTPIQSQTIKFIKGNFDLVALKKAGLIDSIVDFFMIEKRLTARLGLRSITDYRKPNIDVAFSSGLYKPENHLTRAFWIQAAIASLERINNPYEYSREQLIRFFPQIRRYSTNEEQGLIEVIRQLYRIGVTLVFQPSLPTLQLRGATFVLKDKPCIVLTNYMGFYPTLWFALIHELYHVLFDLQEIKESRYHLTDDSNDQQSVRNREKLADEFAREYLFSKEKMEYLIQRFDDSQFVYTYAINYHVHPSIVYALKAYETPKLDQRKAWQRVRRQYSESNFKALVDLLGVAWDDEREFEIAFAEKVIPMYNNY
jgi:HTH-type transcriptional regulator / antitoxin HigA